MGLSDGPSTRWTSANDTQQVSVTMASALGFGILAVILSLAENGTVWRGLLWAGAWSSVGWFLGFLFGIPRYLSTDTARTMAAPGGEPSTPGGSPNASMSKELRQKAIAAAQAKTAADDVSDSEAKKAVQAEKAANDAAALLKDNPQDSDLKADADAKAAAAALAIQSSNAAMQSATDSTSKAQQAEKAATEAEAAFEIEISDRRAASANAKATTLPGASLTVNTNLEQISDWLTKIIVGVSLVESQALLEKMQRAATFMAQSMASADAAAAAAAVASAEAAAIAAKSIPPNISIDVAKSLAPFISTQSLAYAIILYFLATGLLGSYLLTRLFLQRALDNAAKGDEKMSPRQ